MDIGKKVVMADGIGALLLVTKVTINQTHHRYLLSAPPNTAGDTERSKVGYSPLRLDVDRYSGTLIKPPRMSRAAQLSCLVRLKRLEAEPKLVGRKVRHWPKGRSLNIGPGSSILLCKAFPDMPQPSQCQSTGPWTPTGFIYKLPFMGS